MKTHLLYQDRSLDYHLILQASQIREAERLRSKYWGDKLDEHAGLPWNAQALTDDLSLNTLLNAMMDPEDDCMFETVKRVMLAGIGSDLKTIRYRQRILQDCLNFPDIVRKFYSIAVAAQEKKRKHYMSDFFNEYPDMVLRESIELLEDLLGSLRELNKATGLHADKFKSEGWLNFFDLVEHDLNEKYLATVERYLQDLKFDDDSFSLSAELGVANKGNNYLLHQSPNIRTNWWIKLKSFFNKKNPDYSFTLHPRDISGSQALRELQHRGISSVAAVLGQSTENVIEFFDMLRVELSFYISCINLHQKLTKKGEPVCFPTPKPDETNQFQARGLYDVGLTLMVQDRVVGNDIDANKINLIFITGANTGGKSTFLRSVGLAQLMMQAGMFVGAKAFSSSLCSGLFTHYKHEEDTGMESGKFDEELSRMSEIVNHLKPGSLILLNESFASTNEREGSEIGKEIITALREKKMRIYCVTHLYELAHGFYEKHDSNMLFLRAEYLSDGRRTFKMVEEKPLPTSFGEDIYKNISNNPV